MAIVVQYDIKGMAAAKYDGIIRDLDGIGQGMPDGRKYHVSYGDRGGLQVIDVFESPAHLEAFGAKLMPILAKYGVEAIPRVLGDSHHIIVGR